LTGSKKNLDFNPEEKRGLVEPNNFQLSITRQCELLGISRSGYYYSPCGISEKDLWIMRLIDEEYTRHPFYGARNLSDWLGRQGYPACREKVGRLMKLMGLEAIYPKRSLSIRNRDHKVYPYLLRNLSIDHPDQVWCTDVTYIRLKHSFAYLTVVMDWFSRYVLSWELSLSLETDFCIRALEKALGISKPEIFNSDQGCQYTSNNFTKVLLDAEVRISMNGKGRAFDNIMVERLWRTVKYEEVYLKEYLDYFSSRNSLEEYFEFYNNERRHTSLGKRTPSEVYHENRNHLKVMA
jgi:putative transposase